MIAQELTQKINVHTTRKFTRMPPPHQYVEEPSSNSYSFAAHQQTLTFDLLTPDHLSTLLLQS